MIRTNGRACKVVVEAWKLVVVGACGLEVGACGLVVEKIILRNIVMRAELSL
jgi:hypothetical protein